MTPVIRNCPRSIRVRARRRPLALVLTAWIAILLALSVLTGCRAVGAEQQLMYDDNSRIARQGDSYSFSNRVGNSGVKSLAITFGSFNGKQTVWTLDAPDAATVDLDLDAKISGGRFKVCLIDADRTVTTVAEGTRKEKIALAVPKGRSDVAIVGRDARGALAITWADTGNVRIRRTDTD